MTSINQTTFYTKLAAAVQESEGLLCVGIDPDPEKLPEGISRDAEGVLEFNHRIIEATLPYAAAYKLNLAFFEALGKRGWEVLYQTCTVIPDNRITIADGKRGDIGNSARFYAKALFDEIGFDSATVNPYMGYDAVKPFIENPEKGAFVLALTSNKGAEDFQFTGGGKRLFETVAEKCNEWNVNDNIGLVAGATRAEDLISLRKAAPDVPLLIPGIGAQGGDLEAVVNNAIKGFPRGALINSSRGIIYASSGKDFMEAAENAARELRDQINEHLF